MFQISMITASTTVLRFWVLPTLSSYFIQDQTQRPLFGRFYASLAQKSEDSQPTLFHKLLKTLDDCGKLVRVYTQNIDGLELKAGLSTYHRTCPQNVLQPLRCIPLHGTLQYLYCQSCHAVEGIKVHQDGLMQGIFPSCGTCHRKQESRSMAGKRVQSVPMMVPDVILYGQEHPDAQRIAEFQTQDLSGAPIIDVLLVVGTGMHVLGTQRMIRDFARQVRQSRRPSDPSPCVIYLNLDFKQQKKWESTFDLWVQADCQLVANAMLNALKDEGVKRQKSLADPDLVVPDEVGGVE